MIEKIQKSQLKRSYIFSNTAKTPPTYSKFSIIDMIVDLILYG